MPRAMFSVVVLGVLLIPPEFQLAWQRTAKIDL